MPNARASFLTVLLAGAAVANPAPTAAQSPDGRERFEALCISCHGADGTGGARGPSIVRLEHPTPEGHAALAALIRTGTPNGMPAFRLPDSELEALAAYVQALRAPAALRPLPGDPAVGARLFGGAANCASCHIANGRGGGGGPDLSGVALARTASELERAVANHTASNGPRKVTVRTADGRTVEGAALYETLFDLGVRDESGRFHSIPRARIADLSRDAPPPPPVNLGSEETTHLVAYLATLRSPTPAADGESRRATSPPALPFSAVARPRPGEWPTYHGHLSGNRHSPLAEIDTTNVARLAPRWIFRISDAARPQQVTPVVVDGVMYVTGVNQVWALDARTGQQLWHYARPRTEGLVAGSDAAAGINRGVAVLDDRVFLQTDNARLIALDRTTGALLWDVEIADYREHYGSTSAPLAVEDLVITGVSGGDEGIRGLVDAYRASTGERVWRFWTVPARGEPGSETWIGKALEHGCAATWMTGTYDPETRLIYWPTGNPCPDFNGAERQGDNLYSNSVLALEPETGKLRWHFQFTPHDLYDWDANETTMLVDAPFRGEDRKLLLQANRNGFFYVLDRTTGEFLLGEPFVKKLTWATGLDATGRPIRVPGQIPTPEGTRVCPSVAGATNWPSTAYNPATGLFYVIAGEGCSIYSSNDEWFTPGQTFYGGTARRSPGDETEKFVRAIDVQTGRVAWEIPGLSGGVIGSGLLSTAGGLLFFGDPAGGAFVAANARTGDLLWHFDTGMAWRASPMSYAIDGRQYVGIAAGGTVMVFGLVDGSR